MSEEVKNAAVVVPRSMVYAQYINGAFALAISIVLLFGVGDVMTMLQTKTKYPIIEILYHATNSRGATTALMTLLICVVIFTTLGVLASASRLAWAFARDNGLPFPKYFKHVSASHRKSIRSS